LTPESAQGECEILYFSLESYFGGDQKWVGRFCVSECLFFLDGKSLIDKMLRANKL
jgi:hypothetical protein